MGLKNTVNSALERAFGYRLVKPRKKELPPLLSFFTMLKGRNFQPKRIYDVGANHGRWTRNAVEYFPNAAYTLVEPQDHLKSNIDDLIKRGINIEWINAGAGNECGVQSFTQGVRDDRSTFLSQSESNTAYLNPTKVEVTTLNKIASTHSGSKPDLVKIDAEGWDLKVLEGASDLIGITDIFLIEAAVCSVNIENTVLSVMQRFDQLGYRLIDITDLNRKPKNHVLWLTELVFLRRGSPLLDGVTGYE
jgi:FkbM family methyltransferase